MELEKIRAADTAVRWQHDDDVDNCPSCKNAFSVTRRKVEFGELTRTYPLFSFYIHLTIFILDKLSALRHHILRQMFNENCSNWTQ